MNENSRAENHIHQFDTYCKKVLKNEACDGHREEERRWENLMPLSFLSEQELSQLYEMDEYPSDYHRFHVMGQAVDMQNDLLISALNSLSPHKRVITLLAYCFNISDVEIGTLRNVGRRAVQYQRLQSLKEIKKHMEEHKHDELA